MDDSPPGSPIPGILQARVLEWGAIALSTEFCWFLSNLNMNPFQVLMVFLLACSSLQATKAGHPSISGKCLLPLALDSTHNLPGSPPHLSTQTLSEISLWISSTKSRQRLCSLQSFDPQRLDEQEERTDIRLQVKKEVVKSRRERSRAAHLVADGLVLEPRLVQDPLQLLVVEVGHPDGLGQPCILTLLQGL